MSSKFLTAVPLLLAGDGGAVTMLKMVHSLEPERSIDFGDDVVVCADEQGTDTPTNDHTFAVGLEFGPQPIEPHIIAGALARRTFDNPVQERCLRRAYFHASEDCRSCHEVMAKTITRDLHDRFFASLRWQFPRSLPDHPTGTELHKHIIALLLGTVAQATKAPRIILKFERKQGLLAHAVSTWLDEDIDVQIKAMLRLGMVPFLPKIEVQEVRKQEPGAQVCDHLLWRERRALTGKPEGLEDIGLALSHSYEHTNYKVTLYKKGDISLPLIGRLPEPRDPADFGMPQVGLMFYQIEATVHSLAKARPLALTHLHRLLTVASKATLSKPWLHFDNFVSVNIAFLSVVRLAARQSEWNEEQRQQASDLAHLAMIVARQHETRAVSMFDWWNEKREPLVTRERLLCGDERQ